MIDNNPIMKDELICVKTSVLEKMRKFKDFTSLSTTEGVEQYCEALADVKAVGQVVDVEKIRTALVRSTHENWNREHKGGYDDYTVGSQAILDLFTNKGGMMKYRKKPVVIEAFKWIGGVDQEDDPKWIVEAIKKGDVRFQREGERAVTMRIDTLEGTRAAMPGDYIIQGIKGELYPCKPDIFELTYERVEASQ